jgi:acyl-CoA dehydrogenase
MKKWVLNHDGRMARELTVGVAAVGTAEEPLKAQSLIRQNDAFKTLGFQNTQFKLAECTTQMQIHQAFLDRCIELLVDHKLTTETASMIKYSATDVKCCG